eukprot:scaffold221557_cov61-Cyclotella_meneghiniana.AAC.3
MASSAVWQQMGQGDGRTSQTRCCCRNNSLQSQLAVRIPLFVAVCPRGDGRRERNRLWRKSVGRRVGSSTFNSPLHSTHIHHQIALHRE